MKKAVFTGSFDPITKGHEALVLQALPLFDEIIVAIGVNSSKSYMFPLERRIEWTKATFKDYPSIKITHYEGLTADLCKTVGASYIIRGVRTASDFEYESQMAEANKLLNPNLTTVLFMTDPSLHCYSSSLVRDVIKNGGSVKQLVPENIDLKI